MDQSRPRHPQPTEHPSPSLRASPRRVLLAEDERMLRSLFVRLLADDGFEVVDVGDAATALERIYTAAAPFHLLVTDNNMPGMTGAALSRQVRRVWPSLPILCVTGRPPTPEEASLRGQGSAPVRWLLKPVTPGEFLEAVHALLAR